MLRVSILALFLIPGVAAAQMNHDPMHGSHNQHMMHQQGIGKGESAKSGSGKSSPATAARGTPVQPGQSAFAAIQEIVEILEADRSTDWSKVNIPALRQHLIDMDN
ncbi:MAG: hypothetical protein KDJ29_15640, partial [Hyphomicrobiales bacterium]|nr:hypothetical protein [Hyphomicrobiales bacterium]